MNGDKDLDLRVPRSKVDVVFQEGLAEINNLLEKIESLKNSVTSAEVAFLEKHEVLDETLSVRMSEMAEQIDQSAAELNRKVLASLDESSSQIVGVVDLLKARVENGVAESAGSKFARSLRDGSIFFAGALVGLIAGFALHAFL